MTHERSEQMGEKRKKYTRRGGRLWKKPACTRLRPRQYRLSQNITRHAPCPQARYAPHHAMPRHAAPLPRPVAAQLSSAACGLWWHWPVRRAARGQRWAAWRQRWEQRRAGLVAAAAVAATAPSARHCWRWGWRRRRRTVWRKSCTRVASPADTDTGVGTGVGTGTGTGTGIGRSTSIGATCTCACT